MSQNLCSQIGIFSRKLFQAIKNTAIYPHPNQIFELKQLFSHKASLQMILNIKWESALVLLPHQLTVYRKMQRLPDFSFLGISRSILEKVLKKRLEMPYTTRQFGNEDQ